jgi:hypothetical protein
MSEQYKATSSKNPDSNYTTEVILEKDNSGNVTKSIRVGGEPVELDDEQRAKVAQYLNVRKATDEEVKAAEGDPNDEVSDQTEDELAAADQVSTTPAVSPPNSPAAAQAREDLGKSSRRGGGDK